MGTRPKPARVFKPSDSPAAKGRPELAGTNSLTLVGIYTKPLPTLLARGAFRRRSRGGAGRGAVAGDAAIVTWGRGRRACGRTGFGCTAPRGCGPRKAVHSGGAGGPPAGNMTRCDWFADGGWP